MRRLKPKRCAQESNHISGATLCGFWGMFEHDFGVPEPKGSALCVVVPSLVGSALLPFRCPGCAEVPQALACPTTREWYRDKREGRGNVWCPLCGFRFLLDEQGTPLPCALPAGAKVGPSLVISEDGERWQDRALLDDVPLVGAVAGLFVRGGGSSAYNALARM